MNNEQFIARSIAQQTQVTPNEVSASIPSEDFEKHEAGDVIDRPVFTAIDQGEKAVVNHIQRKDAERAQEVHTSRIAMAVAEAMKPDTIVGKVRKEGVVRGTPLATAPEPRSTIKAGIDAVGKAGRKAVFSELPFEAEDLPEGYEVLKANGGGYYATPKENVEEVMYHDSLDERHTILGYPTPKPAKSDGTTVTVTDKMGRTVQDVLVDELGSDAYTMTIKQAEELAGKVGGEVTIKEAEEAIEERDLLLKHEESTFDPYQYTMDEEHPEGYVSKYTKRDDGTIGKGQATRNGQAYPYMFEVAGKGWEVDRGYGELIGSGLTKTEAIKLMAATKPIPKALARKKVRDHLDRDLAKTAKNYPGLSKDKQMALAMMLYQGGNGLDISRWKNTNASMQKAIKTGSAEDWRKVQNNLLNSRWATQQTPERALRIAHILYPGTGHKELKAMLFDHQVARGVVDPKIKVASAGGNAG